MPIELKALEDAVYNSQKLTPLQIRDKGLSEKQIGLALDKRDYLVIIKSNFC